MANFSSSKSAVDPAQTGPGRAGVPSGPAGNSNLGSLRPLSRGSGALRAQLDTLFRDTMACGEAARGWFDGAGLAWRAAQPPAAQAQAAMEGLAVTARLLAVMTWLLDPAHTGLPSRLKPLLHADTLAFPDDHPLATTPGGAIARSSRQVLARAEALSALHGEP
jgi:hypothetical protein